MHLKALLQRCFRLSFAEKGTSNFKTRCGLCFEGCSKSQTAGKGPLFVADSQARRKGSSDTSCCCRPGFRLVSSPSQSPAYSSPVLIKLLGSQSVGCSILLCALKDEWKVCRKFKQSPCYSKLCSPREIVQLSRTNNSILCRLEESFRL